MQPTEPLSKLLKSWQHEAPGAPEFQAAVWAKIGAKKQSAQVISFYRWALPMAASLALIAGAGAAWHQADDQHDQRMAAALVRSIDPLQMTHAHQHTP